MKLFIVVALVVAGELLIGREQAPLDATLRGQLQQLFPSAAAFSSKTGDPPHFKAYLEQPRSGPAKLAGLAFWTTELEPLERGYDGPIQMLVGMDTTGLLTGIVVVAHRELYGDFSIEPPGSRSNSRARTSEIHSGWAPMSTPCRGRRLPSRAPRARFAMAPGESPGRLLTPPAEQ